jgi:hypothetical protein
MSPGWSVWISTGIRTTATTSAHGVDAHMIHLRCRITNRPWRCISLTSFGVAAGHHSRTVLISGRPPYNPKANQAPPIKNPPSKGKRSREEERTESVAPTTIAMPKAIQRYRAHATILGLVGYSRVINLPNEKAHWEPDLSAIQWSHLFGPCNWWTAAWASQHAWWCRLQDKMSGVECAGLSCAMGESNPPGCPPPDRMRP